MRFICYRQPWIGGCFLTLLLFGGLMIYNDVRWRPLSVVPLRHEYIGVLAPDQDALWYFRDALARMEQQAEESVDLSVWRTILSEGPQAPLDQNYSPEWQEALRRFIEYNREALDLIAQGTTKPYMDTLGTIRPVMAASECRGPSLLFGLPMQMIYNIDDVARYVRRPWWGNPAYSLYPIAQVLKFAALDAVLRQDQETFFAMTGHLLALVDLLMKSPLLPDMLLNNLDAGFAALDMVEQGVNRMNLDNDSLERLRKDITARLYNRQGDVGCAFTRHLFECNRAMDLARDASHIPAHKHQGGYSQNLIFDHSFRDLERAWFATSTLRRHQLFYLVKNTIRLGWRYMENGDSMILSPDNDLGSRRLRDFVLPSNRYWAYSIPWSKNQVFGAFSTQARRLWEKDRVLSPLHEAYEPYGELLARARVAECALAAAAYRNDHGKLPDCLEALVPTYLEKVPGDPYLYQEPVRSRHDGDRLVIYSVGPNRQDNRGKKNVKENRVPNYRAPEGDIVFTLLGKASPVIPET